MDPDKPVLIEKGCDIVLAVCTDPCDTELTCETEDVCGTRFKACDVLICEFVLKRGDDDFEIVLTTGDDNICDVVFIDCVLDTCEKGPVELL